MGWIIMLVLAGVLIYWFPDIVILLMSRLLVIWLIIAIASFCHQGVAKFVMESGVTNELRIAQFISFFCIVHIPYVKVVCCLTTAVMHFPRKR